MAFEDGSWIARAQNAEAALTTIRETQDKIKDKFRAMKLLLGAKEKSDGTIDIDFDILVGNLTKEHALQLRAIIDEHEKNGTFYNPIAQQEPNKENPEAQHPAPNQEIDDLKKMVASLAETVSKLSPTPKKRGRPRGNG